MSDTNDVNTQVNDNLNTDADLEHNSNTPQDGLEVNSNSEANTELDNSNVPNSSDIDDNSLDGLSDEEFISLLESGNMPDKSKVKKEGDKDESSDKSSKQTDKQSSTDTSRQRSGSESKTGQEERPNSDPDSKSDKREDSNTVDYKSTYESIFKPFKANGKDITPKTAEDVVSLMQMGANYTKKMQLMAPMRKTFESLNKAAIKEDDLNFLIDLHKGDKEAIKKLLEKHKVDPIDLDMDNNNYVPNRNMVSDEDIEYSSTLEDIQSSIPKINEILTKKWDTESKKLLLKDHSLLKALHEEIELGRFDEVQSKLETEKTFGRYKGKSDVEAYIDIVTKMVNEQNLSNTKPNVSTTDKSTNIPNKNVPDKSKAAPTKATKAVSTNSQITVKDIFSMPEEEFAKLSMRNLA